MDQGKLRSMLEPLVLGVSHFGKNLEFSKQQYLFAKRKDLIARANQPEINVPLRSSETTREASVYLSEIINPFQFDEVLINKFLNWEKERTFFLLSTLQVTLISVLPFERVIFFS